MLTNLKSFYAQTISYAVNNSGIFQKTVSLAINKDPGSLLYLFFQAPVSDLYT